MPRTLWRNYFEKKLKSIVGDGENKTEIISNFFEMRRNFKKYHIYFGLCEILNLSMVTNLHSKNNIFELLLQVVISFLATHVVLNEQFFTYGIEVKINKLFIELLYF
jgi:hypothetical protein